MDRQDLARLIGSNVRKIRIRKKMLQSHISKAMGLCDDAQISRIEAGLVLPTVMKIIQIAAILGTTVSRLIRK